MKNIMLILLGLVMGFSPLRSVSEGVMDQSPVIAVEFEPVMARLDRGGPHFSLTDGQYEWETIKPIFDYVFNMFNMAASFDTQGALPHDLLERIQAAPSFLGLNEIAARGASTIRLDDGGFRSRSVLQLLPEASGLLWRLGGDETDLAVDVLHLPPTALAMTRFSMNGPELFENVLNAVRLVPELQEQVNGGLMMMEMMGVPLNGILEGLKRGHTIAVTFDSETIWEFDELEGLRFPEPGLVLMLSDPENIFDTWILQMISMVSPEPLTLLEVGDHSVFTMELPVPTPTPLVLCMIRHEERLYITTSPDLMRALLEPAVSADLHRPLQAALAPVGDTRASSGWIVSPEMMALYEDLQTKIFETMVADSEDPALQQMMGPMIGQMSNPFFRPPEVSLARQTDSFILSTTLHSRPQHPDFGGAQAMMVPAVGGLLAAIAIPSFQQARTRAQEAACMNNRRMIDAAKDQWAIENNQTDGAQPTLEDLMEFMREKPVCPVGGEYIIGPVGTDAACTVHIGF
jgi:hypothetical protein